MGWLSKQSLNGYRTPKEYLDAQYDKATPEGIARRVLRSALVHLSEYYAAVEIVKEGHKFVAAIVCSVYYNKRAKDGFIFGYKSMCENELPHYFSCPAAILDLLTPTDSDYANEWRQRCRKQLAKRRPQPGDVVVFEEPIEFAKGPRSRFEVVLLNLSCGRKQKLFKGEDGLFYAIRPSDLKNREYRIERKPSASQQQIQPVQMSFAA